MTLRLALLLVSLIIIGVIGLICHQKYQRLNVKKRPSELAAEIESNEELEQEVNTPFFTENVISDIPEEVESVLDSPQSTQDKEVVPPELTTSLEELTDKKKIAQQLAEQMLPVYSEEDFITEYVAIFPNLNDSAKQVNKAIALIAKDFGREIEVLVKLKDRDAFVPIASVKNRDKIRHVKTILELKDKKGVADEKVLASYQQFAQKLATQFGCEYKFALTDDQAIKACINIEEFIKEHDSIIILYILAQPDDSFSGEALRNAVTSAGLEHGEFDFFHFVSSSETNLGSKVYSLANMYKPGKFDLENLDKFSTMGLCAFMVPALLEDPISGFREMCTSSRHIADQLNGVLTTNQRELLSEENYISVCTQITAHKDKLNAAGVENGSALANKLFT